VAHTVAPAFKPVCLYSKRRKKRRRRREGGKEGGREGDLGCVF